jgi:hypothetical protein
LVIHLVSNCGIIILIPYPRSPLVSTHGKEERMLWSGSNRLFFGMRRVPIHTPRSKCPFQEEKKGGSEATPAKLRRTRILVWTALHHHSASEGYLGSEQYSCSTDLRINWDMLIHDGRSLRVKDALYYRQVGFPLGCQKESGSVILMLGIVEGLPSNHGIRKMPKKPIPSICGDQIPRKNYAQTGSISI